MIYSANCSASLRLFRCFLFSLMMQSLVQVADWSLLVRGDDLIKLKDDRIKESSGLAASLRAPGYFWTHNDSGDDADLYAFDGKGYKTGRASLKGTKAIDWEDLSAFSVDGQPWLVVADSGDNALKRKSIKLYLLPEPDPEDKDSKVKPVTLVCKCPDGPMNCEAVAVDMKQNQIWFVAKSALPYAAIYTLPLPDLTQSHETKELECTLTKVGIVAIPMITGMAIDQEKQELVLINYVCAFRYALAGEKPWWLTDATLYKLPKLKQVEAITIAADHGWWITSEGSPCVMTTIDQTQPQKGSSR